MRISKVKKITLAALLAAFAVVCSPLSFPVGASRCCPVQHFVNIISSIFLGPVYSVSIAFCTSLLRNLMGTGTLLAFPGSMCGALLSGLLYKYRGKLIPAYIGELIGTSVFGGLAAYLMAAFIMSKEAAVFGFVIPFFVSSAGGTVIAALVTASMKKTGLLYRLMGTIDRTNHD